eukprot:3343939-Amphidinium_carterae.1
MNLCILGRTSCWHKAMRLSWLNLNLAPHASRPISPAPIRCNRNSISNKNSPINSLYKDYSCDGNDYNCSSTKF